MMHIITLGYTVNNITLGKVIPYRNIYFFKCTITINNINEIQFNRKCIKMEIILVHFLKRFYKKYFFKRYYNANLIISAE